jgi:tRNA G26 N,N-dimethylase Trm1
MTTTSTDGSSIVGSQNNMNTNNSSSFDSTSSSIMTETIKKILFTCSNEIDDIPYYFRSDEIASKLKTNSMPLLEVINKLRSSGYKASRSILNPSAFKTNARIDEIQKCLV